MYNNFGAFLCGQGEFEQAYSLNAARLELLPSSGYLKHSALCFCWKTNRCLSTGIDKLRQVDPSRAEKLRSLK